MEDFKVGDMVEVYNRVIGYVTDVDYRKEEADVEWEGSNDDWNAAVVPFKYLKKVEI